MNKLLSVFAAALSIFVLCLASQNVSFGRVGAGGGTLRFLQNGQGAPAVVFEAGAGSPLESWVRVQPAVSQFASTFAYDRPGNGLSTAATTPRYAEEIAKELHHALEKANVPPPYILVGHSLGGPFIRVFAGMYPREVAGLVLVDPTQEDLVKWAESRQAKNASGREPRLSNEVDCSAVTFTQARVSDEKIPAGIPIRLICGLGPRTVPGFAPAALKEEVLKDQQIFYPAKQRFYEEWLARFPNGRLITTHKSGHGIPFEEPELIVSVIEDLVKSR